MPRKIVVAPDPRLNQMCVECDYTDKSLVGLVKDMTKFMYETQGVGIAAPQVGDNRRVIVIDVDYDSEDKDTRDPLILLNPSVLETSGEIVEDMEGCLSFPGINVPVKRPEFVKVAFTDLNGDEWEIEGDGLLSRCLQHEIDHLNGRTLFDAVDKSMKLQVMAQYEEAKRKGARPGDTQV